MCEVLNKTSEQVKQPLKKTIGRKFGHNFKILVWLFLPFCVCVCVHIYNLYIISLSLSLEEEEEEEEVEEEKHESLQEHLLINTNVI